MIWTWTIETRPAGDRTLRGETPGDFAAAIRGLELAVTNARWDRITSAVSIHLMPHEEAE